MKYRLTLRCQKCATKYKRTVDVPDGVDLSAIADPPCPSCAKVQKTVRRDWSDGRAPGIVGGSVTTKAIDETARIVMEDNKLTDLHDSNLRAGDSMAPKLQPRLQAQVDSFFGGPKRGQASAGINTRALGAAALRGAFSAGTPNPVEAVHKSKVKPPIHIIASSDRKTS